MPVPIPHRPKIGDSVSWYEVSNNSDFGDNATRFTATLYWGTVVSFDDKTIIASAASLFGLTLYTVPRCRAGQTNADVRNFLEATLLKGAS